jgi:prepilin-type N-terminal cleavage/methylation domain-containing protein
MSPVDIPHIHISDEHGYTLIELLVAMVVGLIVSLAAFSILDFTRSDVSRITDRAHVDQTGRVALENIMLALHSACVAPTVTPVLPASTANEIKFISETSPLNANKEPVSSLSTVRLHKIIYTPAAGTLTEKTWTSTGTSPEFKFNEAEPPTTERKLLTGVKQTESTPIFQYYRYYREGDTGATGKLGQLNPNPTTALLEAEAEYVAKVTMSFTLAPESHESTFAKGDRPVALEDSAVLRLAPSSEASSSPNLPCTQQT